MGQYWTRKGDQEDKDEQTVCPWTEKVGHGDRNYPDPNPEPINPESADNK